jgi:hypothetical protein
MTVQESEGRELAKGVGRFFGHAAATVLGLILMVVGVAMGVTIVMLPVGIAVGLAGLLLFLWAQIGQTKEKEALTKAPDKNG